MKNLTGLWILQECVRAWDAAGRHFEWADLERAASQATTFRSLIDPADSAFLSPADMPAAISQFCERTGQPAPQSPGEFARCVFESLSFAYREAVEDLGRISERSLNAIRLVGGGCLNRFLCQMTADACSRPVIAGPVEAAALGNAMAQAVATGHLDSLAQGRVAIRNSVECTTFSPAAGVGWKDAFSTYKKVAGRAREQARAASVP